MFDSHPWTFAKTMPDNPHEYTLRRDWEPDDFNWAVKYLRAHSKPFQFRGNTYQVFFYDGFRYWTMGAPVEKTILINRAVNE